MDVSLCARDKNWQYPALLPALDSVLTVQHLGVNVANDNFALVGKEEGLFVRVDNADVMLIAQSKIFLDFDLCLESPHFHSTRGEEAILVSLDEIQARTHSTSRPDLPHQRLTQQNSHSII